MISNLWDKSIINYFVDIIYLVINISPSEFAMQCFVSQIFNSIQSLFIRIRHQVIAVILNF